MKVELFHLVFPLLACGTSVVIASDNKIDATTEPVLWACNACSLASIEGTAAAHGSGSHIVYDLNAAKVYRSNCEPVSGGGVACGATALLAGDIYDWFQDYRQAWLGNGRSESFHPAIQVDIRSSVPNGPDDRPTDDSYINAFDTITNSSSNQSVTNNILNEIGSQIGLIMPTFSGVTYNTDNGEITAEVRFHDGSKRTYKLNKETRKYEPIANTGIDSDDNSLPETPPHGYSSYTFLNPTGYNPTNIYLLVAPPQLPEAAGGCRSERWDGETLTCAHPF